MENNRAVSITSTDMEKQDPSMIPDEILEYRTLSKSDLVSKVVEARDELATLKKNTVNLAEVKETASKKDHYAVANELYILRQTIKVVKSTILIKEENSNAETTQISSSPAGESKEVGKKRPYNRTK